MLRPILLCGAMAGLLLSAGVFAQSDADLAAAATSSDWLTYGRDYAETRFSPLEQINTDTVDRLGLAWSFDTGAVRGHEATPLVKDGIIYGTRPWSSVFALDARSGELLWNYDPQVDRSIGWKACCDVVNRGVALYEDKVYVGTIDGRLVALDAHSGAEIWSVQTTDPDRPYTITGAPRIAEGKVIIGNGGAELGVRGYVTAYDARTGEQAWRFWVVPGNPADGFENPDMAFAARTWAGEWWQVGGGGTAWDSIIFDPEARLVYVGTGNGAPWSHDLRSDGVGDNLFLSSIVALHVDTGRVAWHYQTTPADNFDYTAVQGLMLAELVIDGQERQVIMQAPKNGFFYVLDRLTGELLSAQPYAEVTWASGVSMETGRPIETPQARFGDQLSTLKPGPGGAHNWYPMSFSPLTGLVYLPSQQSSSFPYVNDPEYRYRPGTWNIGVPLGSLTGIPQRPAEDYAPGTGPSAISPSALLAWDPITNAPRWQVDFPISHIGGTLATAGNLVFLGTAEGYLQAYTADRGDKVWEVDLGVAIVAPPITYALDGKQYLSVMAGWGGATGLFGVNFTGEYKPEGRLWTFVLDGATDFAPVQGQAMPVLSSLPYDASETVQTRGADLYGERCAMCHGRAAISGGALSDLRYASEATYGIFHNIVREGAYAALGMPNLGAFVSEDDAEAIKQYILAQRALLTD